MGRERKLDFQDRVWRYYGNVIIDSDDGHIECDSADLHFSDHQLHLATIYGSPATFELRQPNSDEVTYARAEKLSYDLVTGVIEFSGDATIIKGGNQISSSFLVYNIREQRINARSSGNGDEKVKIIYTPSGAIGASAATDTVDDDTADNADTGAGNP